MAFQRLQSVFSGGSRRRHEPKSSGLESASSTIVSSSITLSTMSVKMVASTGVSDHLSPPTQVSAGSSAMLAQRASSSSSNLPSGPLSSYQYNFDYITKGASAFAASQTPVSTSRRVQHKTRLPSAGGAHAQQASRSSSGTFSSTSYELSSAKAPGSAVPNTRGSPMPSPKIPPKKSLGIEGSAYTFSFGFQLPATASSPVSSYEEQIQALNRQQTDKVRNVTMRPVLSSHSLSSLLVEGNGKESSPRKHKRTPGSTSADSTSSDLSFDSVSIFSEAEGDGDTPPSSATSCSGDPSTDEERAEDEEERVREAAAARVLSFVQAEAQRQRETRRKLLASLLLARSMGKARPICASRSGHAIGGSLTGGSPSHGAAIREAPTKFCEDNLKSWSVTKVYVPSGLSTIVLVDF